MATRDICTLTVEQYLNALRSDFLTQDVEQGCYIVTPFIRPDGDYVGFLAERSSNGRILLSDMGETFAYLYLSGLSLSRRLQQDAERIGGRYGVKVDVNELVMDVDEAGVGGALHSLIQATLGVAALIEKRRPYMNLRFEEEVEATIIGQGKRYDPDYQVRGRIELHTIKFHVNSGLNLLIQPLSRSSELQARHTAERWYYHFDDIKKAYSQWSCVAVLDDRGERQSAWDEHAVAPFREIAMVIRWSQQERFVDMLEKGPHAS